MGELFLNKDKLDDQTTVSNYFIDQYMPVANGEFVKVYIHLLRCANNAGADLSLEKLADTFTCTERDVTRALRYWEKLGLLTLTTDSDSNRIKGISLNECKPNSQISVPKVDTSDLTDTVREVKKQLARHEYTTDEIKHFTSNEDIQQLLFITEAYLGKTLSSADTNTILFFYDTLGFPADLIEYLIEYCANNNKKRMRYIETVALKWSEEGISTVEQAKANTSAYSKQYYPVMKAMGIYDRAPGQSEKEYIVKWNTKLGFSTEIIVEACNRTIEAIHKPDFRYANSILDNWKKKGITSMSDIKVLDNEHREKAQSAKSTPKIKNNFSNFEQRTYDYDQLEKQLLASRK